MLIRSHPHESIVELLKRFQANIYNTQNLGAITIKTDGYQEKVNGTIGK